MTVDDLVERGAGRLRELADRAAARGDGIGEWLSQELREDASFLRKLKPSLIAARARGEAPTTTNSNPEPPPAAASNPNPEPPPAAPSSTNPEPLPAAPPRPQERAAPKPKPKSKRGGGGPSPVVVVGAALVAGILLAKVIDWRGHAHPRD